jgi:hypothetical protein
MRIYRLASLFTVKYKFANDSANLENSLRKQISVLWNYPNKLFPILKACADSGAGKAKTPHEKKAVAGYKFCKKLIELIELLKNNSNTFSVGEIREVLLRIVNLISENKDLSFGVEGKPSKNAPSPLVTTQFPHVSALIFELMPMVKRHDVKVRNDMQGKARTGLSRILSLSSSMLEDIKKLEVMSPEKFTHETSPDVDINQETPDRFSPQRAPVSQNDIIDFLRQHGEEYGLSSKDDWNTVFDNDPVLREEITSVINALNRGHNPVDGLAVKTEIQDILQRHKEFQAKNAPLFEETE